MAKVKMLQGFSGAVDGNYDPRVGDVIEVSAPTALDLVRRGRAEKLEPKKAAKKAAVRKPPEAASTSAPEAAMTPKAKPRAG